MGRNSEITIRGTTPFTGVGTLAFSAKYNLDNKDELTKLELILNNTVYMFTFGGSITESMAYGKFDMVTPIIGLSDVSFVAKVDLTKEDKVLEITMKKEENEKAIHMTGKLIGGALDFNLKSPFPGFENFKTFASFSRSKRSVEFQMMNDQNTARFGASFNSLHLVIRTPY